MAAKNRKPATGVSRSGPSKIVQLPGIERSEGNANNLAPQYLARRFRAEALTIAGASQHAAMALALHFGGGR